MKKINYKKAILFSFLAGLFSLSSLNAQKIDKDKVYSYKIHENDPENSKNLVLNLDPFLGDIYTPNLNFGYGAGASFRFRNLVELSAYGYKSYLDRLELLDNYYGYNTGGVPAGGDKAAAFTHFGATVFFAKKIQEKNDKYLITQKGNTDYYIKIPAKMLTLYGARVGLQSFSTFIQNTNGNIKFEARHIEGYGAPEMTFYGDEYGTMMNSKVLNFGLSRKRIEDLEYQVESFSKKRYMGSTELFADVLLATSVDFENMKVYQQDTSQRSYTGAPAIASGIYSVNENTLKNKLGARIGANYTQHLGLIGIRMGAEFGLRPGPGTMTDGLYLVLKAGITLGLKIDL